jgi:hypothetical protein
MDEVGIYIDEKEHVDEGYVDERGNISKKEYGKKTTYVDISPDGSIVATFNPCKLHTVLNKYH